MVGVVLAEVLALIFVVFDGFAAAERDPEALRADVLALRSVLERIETALTE